MRDRVATARRYEAAGPLPRPPFSSLGHGAAGVAYFLVRHAAVTGERHWLDSASDWISVAEAGIAQPDAFQADSPVYPNERAAIPASVYFGEAGVWCCGTLVAAARNDSQAVGRYVEQFVRVADACPPERVDAASGAAGLLLAAAVLVEQLSSSCPAPLLSTGDRLAGRLVRIAGVGARQAPGELGWLGAAHGWSGIASALLRWAQATGTNPGQEVQGLLDVLRQARLPSGLWPRHTSGQEVWRGWCHGSAGWVQLWTLAGEVLGEPDALALAEHAASDAVAAAADDVGPGLCCGQGGIAYASLALYRFTGDEGWLENARRLAGAAASADAGPWYPQHSVWRGDVGTALLLAELDDPASAAMPFYRRSVPTIAR